MQVWNAATGKQLFTFKGHSEEVLTVAWSPDSKRIASGGGPFDDTVQICDSTTGKLLSSYHGTSAVNQLAWSPNGKLIATGRGDYSVQILQVL